MGLFSDLNPFKGNPLKKLDQSIRKTIKKDPVLKNVKKFVEAPIKSVLAADPLYRKLKYGHSGTNDQRIRAGVHELYKADPIAKNIGIREKDAVTVAKVAGAAAAIYFTAGAAASYYGAGAAAAGAGTAGGAGAATAAAGTTAGASTAATIGATAGAVSAVGQIYGTVQQRKAIKEAEEQAKIDQAAMEAAVANEKVPVMPGPDDASISAARKKAMALQLARRGRSSSILSDESRQALGA